MAQRGYGEPRGGEWGSDERDRGRPYGSSDYGRSDRDDDRGFFERAGEEIRSWFSDEDDRSERGYGRGRERDYGRAGGRSFGRQDRDFERGAYGGSDLDRSRFSGGISDRDRERSYGRTGRGGTDYMDERRGYGRSGGETSRGFGPSRGGGYWESDRERGGMQGSRMSRPGGQQGWQSEYASSGGRGQSSDRDEESGSMYSQYSGTLGGFGNQRVGRPDDQFYMSWRDRQLSELDRDYEDYCREREQSFHQDFGDWRKKRQSGQGSLGDKGELQLESGMATDKGSSESTTRSSGRRGRSASSGASTPTASETGEASTSGSDRTRS